MYLYVGYHFIPCIPGGDFHRYQGQKYFTIQGCCVAVAVTQEPFPSKCACLSSDLHSRAAVCAICQHCAHLARVGVSTIASSAQQSPPHRLCLVVAWCVLVSYVDVVSAGAQQAGYGQAGKQAGSSLAKRAVVYAQVGNRRSGMIPRHTCRQSPYQRPACMISGSVPIRVCLYLP